ncbi:DNA-binding response regulator, OmpR family, contains REC and winged-helix (wHTH) domain [Collimonas sp. OK607]|jgi:DNA-binding response OmpR family regulator|uniref:response regulator transcription factor n=1 Tax=unclassified Collimonas TaxID=2634148 RepID=UPI0008ED4D22|nr:MULTISPECIES: response regulator transcription factor [unclassified Collimonas]SFA93067.1 DNA-binding response regulator, OmpR family, contains REC and winged-helix (wHTH) domain [Collimonas sp. OK607]SFI06829.1 DNA-binding response regulator, OmpR family, contains REC and winged-helix (wHTH) domain [Collimonas sp. OK307]
MRIAVLDDDPSQTDLVCQVLTSSGHVCHPFQSGKEILNQLRRESYDMLVLDWQVPDLSGPEVLRWVRDKLPKTIPVLFITSRSGEDDIVEGLAAGADDYMIKPIRRSELVARVQALLRRAYPIQNSSEQIVFNDYLFETRSGRLTLAGKPIEITQKEFDLALLFFRNLGRPLSRAYILEAVWSRDVDIPSRTMDTHVSRVRSKLQLRPENGYRLAPVYSYGYRLEQLTG